MQNSRSEIYRTREACISTKENNKNLLREVIINFAIEISDDAGYGTIWECFQLSEEECEKLKSAEIDLWIETYFKKKDRHGLVGLHLENIDDVRGILPECSKCYEFNDGHYYGMY